MSDVNLVNENVEETALSTASEVSVFDYNTVDAELGAFLKTKANKIMEVKFKSVLGIGKELKEVNNKLASHDKNSGVFCLWCDSMGFSRMTASRYINAYDFVISNAESIQEPDKLQPSLLFAASKPSAPTLLKEAVMSGDIKTHKEYKELEAKLKASEEQAIKKDSLLKILTEDIKTIQNKYAHDEKDLKKEINQLTKDLEAIKDKQIDDTVSEVDQAELDDLKAELIKKEKELEELKNKPIDVAVEEKIPEDVQNELEELRLSKNRATNVLISEFKNTLSIIKYTDIKDFSSIHAGDKKFIFDSIKDSIIKLESLKQYLSNDNDL